MPYFYRNNIKYSGGSDSVDLTMAEYKELEANGKVVQDTTYYIIDADENIPSRPNLLINSNFANPVNQRGITAETWSNTQNYGYYGFDRWKVSQCNVVSIADGLTIAGLGTSGSDLLQCIEEQQILANKTYALSAYVDGKIISGTVIAKNTGEICKAYEDDSLMMFLYYTAQKGAYVSYLRFKDTNQHTIKWIKLEEGEFATPYVPRLYAEELQLCQRYYRIINVRGNENLLLINANDIMFNIYCGNGMRIKPIPDASGLSLRANNEVTDIGVYSEHVGNTYTNSSSTNMNIRFNKSNHGYTISSILSVSGDLILDAEL